MSIDSIIKQAMMDAGMNPEIEKKATGNKLADDLYALAAECEKLGSARVGVAKSAEQSCLRDLTKAYLFQRMLKSAVEDRLGVAGTAFEKSAEEHETDIRYEYIEAFEKLAAEDEGRFFSTPGQGAWQGALSGAGAGAVAGGLVGRKALRMIAKDVSAMKGLRRNPMMRAMLQETLKSKKVFRRLPAVVAGLGALAGSVLAAPIGTGIGAIRGRATKEAIDMKTLATAGGGR